LEAGVYANCPDPSFRDAKKAIDLIQHAIALDVAHPVYLTILALAYYRSGDFEDAVLTQQRALRFLRPAGWHWPNVCSVQVNTGARELREPAQKHSPTKTTS